MCSPEFFASLASSFVVRIVPIPRAGVAQLVERQPSKLNVAGSNPVSRSKYNASIQQRHASPAHELPT
jgi:hypothetical protein